MQVSLFASAVRPQLWPALFKSLEGTSVKCEVIFAGFCSDVLGKIIYLPYNVKFSYLNTRNIKPAQCYEIARRHCTGEVVVWIADDCEFPNDVIGKAYNYWKSQGNEKLILSIQTKESGYNMPYSELFDMNFHRFYGCCDHTPLMAPLAMMSRQYLNTIGGLDQRYVCGQYENDIVMRAYADGGEVEIFGGEDCYIDIDHLRKSIEIGESVDQNTFQQRPFAKGYVIDRQVLENSWTIFDEGEVFKILNRGERPTSLRTVVNKQLDKFQPYPIDIPLDKSCGNNLTEKWI